MDLVAQIIEILVSGITGIATGIGGGLTKLVTSIFLTGEGTSASPYALSTFGTVIVVFAAVSLAIGLSRWVVNWVTSFGASN